MEAQTEPKRGRGVVRSSGEPFEYEVRFLTPGDVGPLLALHRTVIANLPAPLVLYERDAAFFEHCTDGRGCVVAAIDPGGRVLAYAALYRPGPDEENYGRDLPLAEEDLGAVAHLAGSAVDPEYRGNGLQRMLVDLRTAHARQTSEIRHLCGEVLPMNVISIGNHLAEGFLLKAGKIDKVGLECYVLHMDVHEGGPTCEPHDVVACSARVPSSCLEQMRLGRWGFEVVRSTDEPHIRFGRFPTS